ncbi:MAG: thioredoxin [Candidatus Omnitrophica bacterium]|nr:thioredoxin [Candidatus Omnitrophota bacterium]
MGTIHLTDNNFKSEVLQSDLPVVVDIYATWCGPCKMVAPILEELSKEYAGRVKIGKLDVDESPQVPGRYGVMSVPTLMFFKKGEVMDQVVGALPKPQLKSKIDEVLL